MNKKTYTIGFFTSDYNRGLVRFVLDSLMQYAENYDNLRIRVFDCFGFSYDREELPLANEIYELPDLNDFDGVIVQSHQIINESALSRLGERIRKKNIPAVSIGDFMDGCTRINTDDYSAFRDVTKHIIEHHNARTFLFLKGVERIDGGEAEARRRGFEDECREHGIDISNISYAEGDWLNKAGRRAAKKLLKSGRPLPDAIVSANDEMALGAMTVLQEAGIRVPEDVIVTGYDDTLAASLSNPRLTTVRRDFRTMVFTAMDTLRKKVKYNEDLPELVYSPYQLVFAGTCGCHWDTTNELSSLKADYYRHNRELTRFYNRQDKVTSELFFADSPSELLDVIENNASIFGGGDIFICANDFYHDSLFHGGDESAGGSTVTQHYSDRFFLTACSKPGRPAIDSSHIYHSFTRPELLKNPYWADERFLIFYPLHFETMLMGFFVMTRSPASFDLSMHEVVLHLFEFAVEKERQQIIVENLNKRLDQLYITDSLTGLYNRFGYERFSKDLFTRARDAGSDIYVLFIDIDNMKSVNDTYGHDYGDRAIIAVAQAIKDGCGPQDFMMRYGGDEYVVITEDPGSGIKERIVENMRSMNDSGELPFKLNVSIGEYRGTPDPDNTVDDLLKMADRQMYLEKNEKKSRAGS